MSLASGLETRRLDTLALEKTVDRFAVDTQHTSDAHGVESPVVDQTPNRFGMNAELVGDIANADQALGLTFLRRHVHPNLPQVTPDCAIELPRRHRARELRLHAAVGTDEERPRLRREVPLLVPAVESLAWIVPGIDLDVDEADTGPGEPAACRILDVDERTEGPARTPARSRENQ